MIVVLQTFHQGSHHCAHRTHMLGTIGITSNVLVNGTHTHTGPAMYARHYFALVLVLKQLRTIIVQKNDIHLLGTRTLLDRTKCDAVASSHTLTGGMQRQQRQ